MDEEIVISAENISKSFGAKNILQNINLSLHKGEAIAITGVNGSGKSTLLRILAGLMRPSSGKVLYPNKYEIAYIPDKYDPCNLELGDFMEMIQRIEGVKLSNQEKEEIINDLYLQDMIDVKMKNMSKGTLQKVAVIQALIKKRDILFMDEPLSGQDERSKNNFIRRITRCKKEGCAVIMCCHEPFLAKAIADKTFEINKHTLLLNNDYYEGIEEQEK